MNLYKVTYQDDLNKKNKKKNVSKIMKVKLLKT